MDWRERIIWILINTGWILLGSLLNIFYPNIFSINNLLPNFLIIFSVIISFNEGFIDVMPIIILGGIIDSIWRWINPGINTLSLIVACGMIYFIFHRLWKSWWIVILSVFLATIIYFLVSYPPIYTERIGIFTYSDALNFGLIQGLYNTFWCSIFILFVKSFSR